ncbi:MAG: SDR family oxidoreductase [Xanthobacteraceae bacterium]|nr:SDR family oxidoreductase [Xanthobacteraceae bacterium]
MASEFADKVVVVTGGSRGIGRAIALAFAREGARTVLAASSAENLAAAAATIAAAGGAPPLAVAGDLRDPEACAALHRRVVEAHGRCDVLVNCAGATRGGDFLALAEEAWQDGFALKFFACVRLCRLFWPQLAAAQGHVVNIVGTAARTPDPLFLIGGSVNAAMANFTKGLAALGKRDGVNVNAILPGIIETERFTQRLAQNAAAQGVAPEAERARLLARDDVRRFGAPEDVAALALFLCRPEARHIQGTAIAVDGGATTGLF